MQVLDGKVVSEVWRRSLTEKVREFVEKAKRPPGLAVVLVGDDPASQVYVRNKGKACAQVGIQSTEHKLSGDTSEEVLKKLIYQLNEDQTVDGILVQLPLPKHLDSDQVLSWISPAKDPDGLTIENQGLMLAGRPRVKSCTPAGVMAILEHYKVKINGAQAVVVGRSNIVGKPMALLLQQANATVTVCHSKTPNISAYTQQADIVVVAVGQPQLLGREDFKAGSVVVDVGIHRQTDRDGNIKLCGDVRFSELESWVRAATPVPGGVGPMTITMLLENTLTLAELAQKQ